MKKENDELIISLPEVDMPEISLKEESKINSLDFKNISVSKLYELQTGKPWNTAKSEGLTDGSYKQNMDLRAKLLNNKPINIQERQNNNSNNNNNSKNKNTVYDNEESFSSAFNKARSNLGSNQIFEYKGRKYTTNIAGEEFKPSEETLKSNGINQPSVKRRIEIENSLVASPYSSKDKVEIKPEFTSWKDIKERNIELNKIDQASLIVNFNKNSGSDKPYAIIDKKKGLLHIYKPGSDFPIYSSPVDLGETISDAQTVTKVNDPNNDGIITKEEAAIAQADFAKGNKSTGAGKFYISNISLTGYKGKPLFNLMNESQYNNYRSTGKVENVATSFHTGYIPDDNARVSNGCIRCNKPTLDALYKYMKNLSEVYILPEEEGNAFVYENGKLNFRANSKSNYESYIDSRGEQQKGQGINRTTNTLNYIPIKIDFDEKSFRENVFQFNDLNDEKEMKQTTIPFVNSLAYNKQKVMKAAGINGDVYNDIAQIAFGIYGAESNYGDTHSALGNAVRAFRKIDIANTIKQGKLVVEQGLGKPDVYSSATTYNQNKETSSVGLTQIKFSSLNEREKSVLKNLGITNNMQLFEPETAALATTAILAVRYQEQLNSKEKQDIYRYLPGTWNNRPGYHERVMRNARFINIKQKNNGL